MPIDSFSAGKIYRTSLSNEVVKEIRKMILTGTIKPGQRINEVHLARDLQVSRGPVREALLMLKNEGLVTHEVNRGATVSILSARDAYEIYTFRAMLEVNAIEMGLENLQDEHLQALSHLLERFAQSVQEANAEELIACDIEFHKVIVGLSKHSRLIQAHSQMDSQVGAMFLTIANELPKRVNRVVEIHQILYDTLASRDKEKIIQELNMHYLSTLKELESKLKEAHG